MKIYKWYNGKVEAVEVLKETNKLFIVDRPMCFECRSSVYKTAASLTEIEAVDERHNFLVEERDKLIERLKSVEDELEIVRKWPEHHKGDK